MTGSELSQAKDSQEHDNARLRRCLVAEQDAHDATFEAFMAERAKAMRYEKALGEIVRRERRSEYTSIYSAPTEFARIAREALAAVPEEET